MSLLRTPALDDQIAQRYYAVGEAHGLMAKAAADEPVLAPRLAGRLYLSQSGWLLLDVPNALIRGLFSALNEPGIELPYRSEGQLNGHISVARKEEIEKAGGPEVFAKDRGRVFHYQLGPVKSVRPPSWDGVSKVWFVEVKSPELEALRKSYGLTPLPNDNKFRFHATFAVLKTNVLRNHPAAKAASAEASPGLGDVTPAELADQWMSRFAEIMGRSEPSATRAEPGRMLTLDDLRAYAARAKQAEEFAEVSHDEAKVTRARVEKVIKTLPAFDLYGVWYHPGPPARVRVSLGDWSGIRCDHVKHRLSLIPDLKIEVDAEIGAPREAGWEKLEGRDGGEYNPGEFCPGCDAQCEGDPYDKTCNSCGYKYEEKSAGDDEPKVVIDRPKGFKKQFDTPDGGKRTVTYPLDYGYFKGLNNPQDDEDCDVFVGAGEGSRHGRYMKGDTMSGQWKPDEYKWYTNLTDAEHAAMMKFYDDLDPKLVRDEVTFDSREALIADVLDHAVRAKIAAVGNWLARVGSGLQSGINHAAGVAPGQRFFGTPGQGLMSRTGTSLSNLGRFTFNPRYPGLDRPLHEMQAIKAFRRAGGTGLPAGIAPRVLDRTRGAIGTALRVGPRVQLAAGLAHTAYTTPRVAAHGLVNAAFHSAEPDWVTQGDASYYRDVKSRLEPEMYKLMPEAVAGLMGKGSTDPVSQAHSEMLRETALPYLRNVLWRNAEKYPNQMAILDTLRMATPFGAMLTAGKRMIADPTPPDFEGALQRALDRHSEELLADPTAATTSPYTQAYARAATPNQESIDKLKSIFTRYKPAPGSDAPLPQYLNANPEAAATLEQAQALARLDPSAGTASLRNALSYLRPRTDAPQTSISRYIDTHPRLRTGLQAVQSVLENPSVVQGATAIGEHPVRAGASAIGGGLLGAGLGAGAGHLLAGDDENLPYEQRRKRERIRTILATLGGLTGAGLAPFLTVPGMPGGLTKTGSGQLPALARELVTRPIAKKRPQTRPAPAPAAPPQETAQQEYQQTMALIESEGEKRRRPTVKRSALRDDVPPLADYQERAEKKLNDPEGNGRLLIYHGLGSGKSRTAIAAAETAGGPYAAVVPAGLRPNFRGEIERWTDGQTPTEVLSYSQAARGHTPSNGPTTLIADEAHRLRNPESDQSKAVERMAEQAKKLVLLTGSPIVNAPGDLAVPYSLLTGEKMSPRQFESRYVGTETVHPGLLGWLRGARSTTVPTVAHEDELAEKLRGKVDYQPSRNPEGVTTHEERIPVELSHQQQSVHNLLWNRVPWLLRWKLERDFPINKEDAKRLSSFLSGPRQAALSTLPFQGSKDPYQAFQSSAKIQEAYKRLQTTLGKDPRAKAIVYSNFPRAGLVPYAAGLEHAGIPYSLLDGSLNDAARKAELARYNTGNSRVLLYGPSAAEGISTKGTQLVQLLDPHWNETRMNQARARGLRFDSHVGLPDDLKDVQIQRFVSTTPEPGWLSRLLGNSRRPTADEVLERQAQRREELLDRFRGVLQRIGSEPARNSILAAN